jgi:hypothetical protein
VLFILLRCHRHQLPIHCTGLILCKRKFWILPQDVSSAEEEGGERSQQEDGGGGREGLLLLPIDDPVGLASEIQFQDAVMEMFKEIAHRKTSGSRSGEVTVEPSEEKAAVLREKLRETGHVLGL